MTEPGDPRSGSARKWLKLGSISVVVPNYNHARYLGESLDAIARQSTPPLEVLVVDDASTDDSVAVIESFVRRYPFITLLRHEVNQGVFGALRTGWRRCRGDYVSFIAADDVVRPGLFEKCLSLLARHPQAGLCSSMGRILSADGRDLGPYHTPIPSPRERYINPSEFIAAYLRHGNWVLGYSAIYRSAVVAESGVFEPGSDLRWHFDAYKVFYAGAKYGACFIPEPLVLWRRLEDSWGFRSLTHAGLSGALEHVQRLERCLRHPRCAGLFPKEFFLALWRQFVDVAVYEYLRRYPDDLRPLLALESRVPRPSWLDRAYFGALRRGWAGIVGTKLYLTLRKPLAEQWRILRRKLGGGRLAE
ncbi:MAG: glycosyltransferase family 2 protein [Elusimicrobia bacterium]|nr:glycosyltransferase family 2 protein [Elusimicrobiota bacterium]